MLCACVPHICSSRKISRLICISSHTNSICLHEANSDDIGFKHIYQLNTHTHTRTAYLATTNESQREMRIIYTYRLKPILKVQHAHIRGGATHTTRLAALHIQTTFYAVLVLKSTLCCGGTRRQVENVER